MYRTGVMAPPDLYDLPPQPGLMARGKPAEAHHVSARTFLWVVALVLGLVELCVQVSTP
jgi:hypothetical protein